MMPSLLKNARMATEGSMGKEILPLDNRFSDYLRDESRNVGRAESISFPESEADVRHILATLRTLKTPTTVQGSRTGICGGAVPDGGHILNLSRMKDIVGMAESRDGCFSIRVQPGISLAALTRQLYHPVVDTAAWDDPSRRALHAFSLAEKKFWPPDPTEDSASIGGIAANNAGGITAHYYGPARRYISAIRFVDSKGDGYQVERGRFFFSQGKCPHPNGKILFVESPPTGAAPVLDLIDVYLGSEGMLGVITELTLKLLASPKEHWAIVFFFTAESEAANFIEQIRTRPNEPAEAHIVAVEFLDHDTLFCIDQQKEVNNRLAVLPDVPSVTAAAVYLELHGDRAVQVEDLASQLLEMSAAYGCDQDTAWAFSGEQEMKKARLFRHAAPESVNGRIDSVRRTDPRICKLGTDMRMAGCSFADVLGMYRLDLDRAGLQAAIFGHAGDLHLHVNILPKNHDEFLAGQKIIAAWAKKVDAVGGSVVTEHGVGKVKKCLFRSLPFPRRLEILRHLKEQLDPEGLFNPGNMFELNR